MINDATNRIEYVQSMFSPTPKKSNKLITHTSMGRNNDIIMQIANTILKLDAN